MATKGNEARIVVMKEILLEAPGCVKMEVETLACVWMPKRPTIFTMFETKENNYVNGPYGEVYLLKRARGICGDRWTLAIGRRTTGAKDTAVSLRPAKLKGVAEIFTVRNVVRARWRRWNRQRLSGIRRLSRDDVSSDEEDSSDDDDDSMMAGAREIMENVSSLLESTLRMMRRVIN
jgi:hypothetical protein